MKRKGEEGEIGILYPWTKYLQIGAYPIRQEIILLEAHLAQMHCPFTSELQDKDFNIQKN